MSLLDKSDLIPDAPPSYEEDAVESNDDSKKPVIGPDGNKYPSFDDAITAFRKALEKACDEIFGPKGGEAKHPSLKEYQQKELIESYDGVPGGMREHGRHLTIQHTLDLMEHYTLLRQSVPERTENDTIIIGGGGDGRLLKHHILLAEKSDIKRIIFNDLNPQSVEIAKDRLLHNGFRIEYVEGNDNVFLANGVRVEFCSGDLRTFQLPEGPLARVIAIFLDYYVSAEFLDPSEVEKIHEVRKTTFQNLYKLLSDEGILFDNRPNADKDGFYRIANRLTRQILEERKILSGEREGGELENKNLMFENWQFLDPNLTNKTHIRYAARYRVHNALMQGIGFTNIDNESQEVPRRALCPAEDIEGMTISALRGAKSIDHAVTMVSRLVNDVVEYDPDEYPFIRFEITSIWRKNGEHH